MSPSREVGASVLADRHHALSARLEERGLDALLVTHLPNLEYLTGLHASAGAALVTQGTIRLMVDSRYLTAAMTVAEADNAPSGLQVVSVDASYDEAIRRELLELGAQRVAIEPDHVTVQRWEWLTVALGGANVTLVPVAGLVESGRLVKDADEVTCFRAAGSLLAAAMERVRALVRPGKTEREIAAEIDHTVISVGFVDRAFPTIVASGPNSALPHAQPTLRRVITGDVVLLDFGGVYDGYSVDLSRTVSVGEPTTEIQRLHRAVLEAQANAIGAVRPGVPVSDIDSVARTTLADHGLAEAFGHSTGHGLGLEIHEAPRIGRPGEPGADAVVQTGMVFTIEPGVYLPGVGGVRIEDDVVVTSYGCDVITETSRALTL